MEVPPYCLEEYIHRTLSLSLSLSGVSHGAFLSDITLLQAMREFYEYIPLNNKEEPPYKPTEDSMDRADESLRYRH